MVSAAFVPPQVRRFTSVVYFHWVLDFCFLAVAFGDFIVWELIWHMGTVNVLNFIVCCLEMHVVLRD